MLRSTAFIFKQQQHCLALPSRSLISHSLTLTRTFCTPPQDPSPSRHFKLSTHPHPLERVSVPEEISKLDIGSRFDRSPERNDVYLRSPVYTKEEVESVQVTHKKVSGVKDFIAYSFVQTLRKSFDLITGYKHDKPFTEEKWLNRFLFLETVAGVPGMVGGMARHLQSLRHLHRDYGWIGTLLEESQNERMHLLTFLQLKSPGLFFRMAVLFTQGIFFNTFFLFYLLSPSLCHRVVGYLEQEAVKTYTHAIADLRGGHLPTWGTTPAPQIAKNYWKLSDDAMMVDVLLAVRADEANHRAVNHTLGELKQDQPNPVAH